MTADIDPAFAARCDLAAARLRALSALSGRPDTDAGALEVATTVTADLLADPEALLAVALTIEQARAAALPGSHWPGGRAEYEATGNDPRLAATRQLRDKLEAIYRELPPVSHDDPRVQSVLAEIQAVWA